MGIGASIFLIAVGAILAFAVDVQVTGIDLHAVGWILMVVGVIGLALFFAIWGPRSNHRDSDPNRDEHAYRDDYPPRP